MDLIHKFLNVIARPLTFFSLCFLLPPYLALKFFLSMFASIFAEDVAGKVVLITGASSGIGESIAYEYAMKGACLSLSARREHRLREVAELARELGSPDVIVVRADVSNVDDCKKQVEETIKHFGRLDHHVNNAGVTSVSFFEETKDVTGYRTVMDINFWGSVHTTCFAIPHLKNSKGKIIAISSAAAYLPDPRMSIYGASKAAMVSFYETLRVELGHEVNVLVVTPGFIESEMTQGKFFSKEGKVEVDPAMRDVQIGIIPVLPVQKCAESIVKSACRGDKYLTEPAWFKANYIWYTLFPEMVLLVNRLLFMHGPGKSTKDTVSKKILDLTGAKKILYPPAMQSHEVEIDET